MDFLSGWIISIVGVVVLGVLVDVIISDGQTAKYVRSIFALVTALVIAAPIVKLATGDEKFDLGIFGDTDAGASEVDEDYLKYLFDLKVETLRNEVFYQVKESGSEASDVTIDAEDINGKFTVKSVKIVINGERPHINIIDKIVRGVSELLNINKENIEVYGREQGSG